MLQLSEDWTNLPESICWIHSWAPSGDSKIIIWEWKSLISRLKRMGNSFYRTYCLNNESYITSFWTFSIFVSSLNYWILSSRQIWLASHFFEFHLHSGLHRAGPYCCQLEGIVWSCFLVQEKEVRENVLVGPLTLGQAKTCPDKEEPHLRAEAASYCLWQVETPSLGSKHPSGNFPTPACPTPLRRPLIRFPLSHPDPETNLDAGTSRSFPPPLQVRPTLDTSEEAAGRVSHCRLSFLSQFQLGWESSLLSYAFLSMVPVPAGFSLSRRVLNWHSEGRGD